MLITFFIGNGFDLNNEMKTKFTDFYDHIKSTRSKDYIEKNFIYTAAEEDRDKWSYFELQLGKLTFEHNNKTKNKLLNDIDDFRDDFIDYMTNQNRLFSFDKIKAKQTLIKTLTQYRNHLNEEEREDIANIYNRLPSDIMFNFINFNYTDTLEQVVNLFEKGTPFSKITMNNMLYGGYLREVIPIHKQLQTGMFLGVNDETQLNSKIFSEIERRSLIKPLSNEGFRDNTNKNVENLIDKSHIVIIYGMSLGETDKKWWIYLGKWLKKDSNNRLIIYIYDVNFSKINPRKYFEKRKEYEDRFIGFSHDLSDLNNKKVQEEIGILRKRIYLIPNATEDFKFSLPTKSVVELTN